MSVEEDAQNIIIYSGSDTGAFEGQVQIGASLGGTLQLLGGPVNDAGPQEAVVIGANLTGQVIIENALERNVVVYGNVDRTASGVAISVGQSSTGQIRVYGSLYDDPNEAYEIRIGGTMPFPGAVTIDWDGDQEPDYWRSGAVIRIWQTDYHGNEEGWPARVYDVSACRGDMQGDGYVGLPDINPFIMALTDVMSGSSNYATWFPGLEGSMTFHADADCNGVVDFADINPFVARVSSGNCDCTDLDAEPPMTPRELALMLADNIWPELYDDLVWVVGEAIDWQESREPRAYWTAVHDALTE